MLSLEVKAHHRPVTVIKLHHPVQVLKGVHIIKYLVPHPELLHCFYLGGGGGYMEVLSLLPPL